MSRQSDKDSESAIIIGAMLVLVLTTGIYTVFFVIFDSGGGSSDTPTEISGELGEWNGIEHDDDIESKQGNKVPREDLDIVKDRAIARLEVIRQEQMREDVEVTIRTRKEFKEDNPFQYESQSYASWSNTIWFAQLIVPGQVDIGDVRSDLRGNQTLAYYMIEKDKLVVIVEETENGYVRVDEETLIHELTHAMQDQRIGLENDHIHSEVTTLRQSQLSIIEGEARLVEELYRDRCRESWDCFEYSTEVEQLEYNMPGYVSTSLSVYDEGERYMKAKYNSGGWEAVDKVYTSSPPIHMGGVLYPNDSHPDDKLVIRNIAERPWDKYNIQGAEGQDSIGMIGISSMIYHYENKYNINTNVDGSVGPSLTGSFRYKTDLTRELEYDAIMPYRTTGNQKGFVWTTVWESDIAADRFTNIYGLVLTSEGGSVVEDSSYQLSGDSYNEHTVYSGPPEFQGYFSVARNDNMVVITYAEKEQDLSELRPPRSEPLALKQYDTVDRTPPEYEIKDVRE